MSDSQRLQDLSHRLKKQKAEYEAEIQATRVGID